MFLHTSAHRDKTEGKGAVTIDKTQQNVKHGCLGNAHAQNQVQCMLHRLIAMTAFGASSPHKPCCTPASTASDCHFAHASACSP
jgi:hypothetical protein